MWKLLVLTISLVGAFAAEETTYQNPPNNTQAAEVQAPPQVPPTKPGVKNITAGGRYHGGNEYGHEHGGHEYGHGHGGHEYGHGHGGHEYGHGHHGHRIFRGYDAPLIDDYICDLDATILVVTNSEKGYGHDNNNNNYGRTKREAYGGQEYGKGRDSYGPSREYGSGGEHYGRDNYENRDSYGPHREHHGREYGHHYDRDHHDRGYDRDHHGYGHSVGVSANADRLRCSVIASIDEDACTDCCRLSARRDRSISKHKIIGFLVDNNQLNYDSQAGGGEGYADNYSARKKRSENIVPAANYGQDSGPAYEVPNQEGDYRCVCCAPKRYRPFIFDRYSRRHHHHYGGHEGPY